MCIRDRLKGVRSPGHEGESADAAPYVTDGLRILDAKSGKPLSEKQVRERILYADPKAVILTGSDLEPGGARVEIADGMTSLHLTFTMAGSVRFAAFTHGHINEYLGVVLDGRLLQAPVIRSAITSGEAVLTGVWQDEEEARELAALLNAGALPVDLKMESIRLVRPGADSPSD